MEAYQLKSAKIEAKVKEMKMYEDFLERVKEQNPDEFPELNDIVLRHSQLIEKQKELQETQTDYADRTEDLNNRLIAFEKEVKLDQLRINNNMAE